ncbi:molybdenum cofactor biosysynthesis protein [Winogradskya humida]|uniref:Molybdenum cofactor sulfurase n=1 Tax=Winogradskya humida TaxID=113566 RepID=A0ABQ3ZL04_9ACTN|nr:molybdenum cofactor biosysynthesis protein [Actinoplanes humidus]GIE18877.1 molybdenum cofactor sulfurase [Actinoplanes humidus]
MAEIVQLLASGVHRYEGRPKDGPAPAPEGELVEAIVLRAGLGVVGDRYFGKQAHKDASVTVIAREGLPAGADLRQTRRNILVAGIEVDELVGAVLSLDSGDGAVRLSVRRRANPCAWMEETIGPGAFKALRGKGGIRCVPLDDGTLRLGPVKVEITRE